MLPTIGPSRARPPEGRCAAIGERVRVSSMILTDDEFKLFSQLIYDESGISIKEAKREFLQVRLQKRLQANQLISYYRYYKLVSDKNQGQRELLDLVDSLTINETSFFRNRPQFDIFADMVIPELLQRKSSLKRLRIWSAGCSRGHEPYSIAMTVLNRLGNADSWDVKVLASDISLRVLEMAQRGRFTEYEIENVQRQYRDSYFEKVDSQYQVKPQLRKLIVFDYHNLKHENGLSGLDAIFCRNVMIYFDREEQQRLVSKFHKSLADGGYLFLGHTETLQGLSDKFRFIYHNKGAVYQKTG